MGKEEAKGLARRKGDVRPDDPFLSLCMPRRALFAGLGLAVAGIAAGPVVGPELALAGEASTWPRERGDFSAHSAGGTKWWNSNRGEYMYCIDRTNHHIAETGQNGTTVDLRSKLDADVAKGVEYLLANGPKDDSDCQRQIYGQPPSGRYGEWWRSRLMFQWAIWSMVEGYHDSRSWRTIMDEVTGGFTYDSMHECMETLLRDATNYIRSSSTRYAGYAKAWQPSGGCQPLAYYNKVLTTNLRFGVTPAAKNGHALSDGVYRIRSAYDESYYWDAAGDPNMGNQLKLWHADGSREQLFHIRVVDGWNLVEIRPLTNLALTYDVANAGGSGTSVIKWYQNKNVSANQRFYMEHSDNGSWCFCPSHSVETALDVSSYSLQNGTTIETWSRTRQSNGYGTTSKSQRWYLERYDTNSKKQTSVEVDSYTKPVRGAVYGVYPGESTSGEVGRFTIGNDGWGQYPAPWSEVNDNWFVHMISAPSGYRFDNTWYRFRIQESLIDNSGRPWMFTSLEPSTCTVRFYVVTLDGASHLQSSAQLTLGTTLTTAAACFAEAEAKAKANYPTDYALLRKWYRDAATATAFASLALAGDLNLYSRTPVTVTFVVVAANGTQTQVHSTKLAYRTTLGPSHDCVKAADGKVASRFPDADMSLTRRWFTDVAATTGMGTRTLTSSLTLYARLPVTVRFMWQKGDGTWAEARREQAAWGLTLTTANPMFGRADGSVKDALGVEVLDYVRRWFTSMSGTGQFSSKKLASDLTLYAIPVYGQVTYYCDGTDEAHVVAMADGTKAKFAGIALGTRVTVKPEVTEAARRPGCTPGLAAWYTDPADPAVARADFFGEGASRFDSAVLAAPRLDLYAANRATVSFDYADGSVVPDEGWELRVSPDHAAAEASMALPASRVGLCDRTMSLPSFDRVYRHEGGGSWRALTGWCWYPDSAATQARTSVVTVAADQTLYVLWRYDTSDGIVDERWQG